MNSSESFSASDRQHPLVEFRAETLALELIANECRQLRFILAVNLAEASDTDDLWRSRAVLALDDQRHFAIVIDEADTRETFVRSTSAQLHRLEVAEIDRTFAELLVELNDQRFVFWTDRTNRDLFAILHLPLGFVTNGIWTHCGFWKLLLIHFAAVYDDARI